MLPIRVLMVIALSGIPGTLAQAADAVKGHPGPAKEPRYASKAGYTLLTFGKKDTTRRWLVIDGDTIYFDRTGSGDLTDEDNRIGTLEKESRSKHLDVKIIDGKDTYRLKRLDRPPQAEQDRCVCLFVDYEGKYDQVGTAFLTRRPSDAPILCFGGPLRMHMDPVEPFRFQRGGKAKDLLSVFVGTIVPNNAGDAKKITGGVALSYDKGIPAEACPVAEVEFPESGAGDAPTRVKWVLRRRC